MSKDQKDRNYDYSQPKSSIFYSSQDQDDLQIYEENLKKGDLSYGIFQQTQQTGTTFLAQKESIVNKEFTDAPTNLEEFPMPRDYLNHTEQFPNISQELAQIELEADSYALSGSQINLESSNIHEDNNLKEQKLIFRQVNLKAETTKNTNLPKFFIRLFKKYLGQKYQYNPHITVNDRKRLKQFFIDLKNSKDINHYNLADLNKLLGYEEEDRNYRAKNRQAIHKILKSRQLVKEIKKSKLLKNKKSYLIAFKVYALRARSPYLTQRLESR